jgi:hypothetical protein
LGQNVGNDELYVYTYTYIYIYMFIYIRIYIGYGRLGHNVGNDEVCPREVVMFQTLVAGIYKYIHIYILIMFVLEKCLYFKP